jgi:exosortase
MSDKFTALYQGFFFSSLGVFLLLERVSAFRRDSIETAGRWTTNIGLLIISGTIASLAIPAGLYGFAEAQATGPLARLGVSVPAQVLVTVLFLDLWRYWEHRLFHRAALLWRLHLVHHSDTQIDVTTTERHHPLESLVSIATTMALILACGLPAAGIGAYLLIATVVSLWCHSNLRVPRSIEHFLRWMIVTPRVHALHHSDNKTETDSNYGTVLTLWDRVFRTYVDPNDAKSPRYGLEYFHRAPDTGLGRVLLQPFLYRVGMAYPGRDGASEPLDDVEPALPPRWRSALLGGAAGGLLAAVVLWPTALDLAAHWLDNEAYQYAWLVVPTALYAAWDRRQAALAIDPQPGFIGALVAAMAALLWGIAALANIDLGRHIALVLALQGIAMAMLGWRCYWRFFPILALLFLAIPSGDLLQPLLRILAVKSIELVAALGQLPYTIDGFVVHIGSQRYVVIDECSGLSYVTMAMFLSYSFGLLLYRSFLKVVALALFGAAIGILANALRINSIVLIDWFRGSQMELTAHGGVQWIALLITLTSLLLALSRLKPDAREAPQALEAAPEAGDSVNRFAPVGAGLGVLVILGIVMNSLDDGVEARAVANAVPPERILEWKLEKPAPSWAMDRRNQAAMLTAAYVRKDRKMDVLIIQLLSPAAKIPESMLAPHDSNVWREARVQRQSACVESHCLPLVHTTWQRQHAHEQRHVFYSYVIDGFTTDSKLALRLAQGWQRLTGGASTPRLIAFVFADDPPPADEIAAAFLTLRPALGVNVGLNS